MTLRCTEMFSGSTGTLSCRYNKAAWPRHTRLASENSFARFAFKLRAPLDSHCIRPFAKCPRAGGSLHRAICIPQPREYGCRRCNRACRRALSSSPAEWDGEIRPRADMVECFRRTVRAGRCLRGPAALDRSSYARGGALRGWMLCDQRTRHSRDVATTPLLNLQL